MSIVGGMFGLEEPAGNASRPWFIGEKSLLTANARSAIALLVQRLRPGKVWVPSYLCPSILWAIHAGGGIAEFYPADGHLGISSREWLGRTKPGDLAILISYFGWPPDPELVTTLREREVPVLEDASQAMLSRDSGRLADFCLLSPRKFLGIPDGGVLILNQRSLSPDDFELGQSPHSWWMKALLAFILRREFDLHGGPRRWYELYQEAESINPIGPYLMSELSERLLVCGFRYEEVAEQRIANYRTLLDEIGELALFPELPEGVVPLGFPIRVRERDRVRQGLFERNIYPPVHWSIREVVPEQFHESHILADEIMTLPCDQRYHADTMRRMASAIRKELA